MTGDAQPDPSALNIQPIDARLLLAVALGAPVMGWRPLSPEAKAEIKRYIIHHRGQTKSIDVQERWSSILERLSHY